MTVASLYSLFYATRAFPGFYTEGEPKKISFYHVPAQKPFSLVHLWMSFPNRGGRAYPGVFDIFETTSVNNPHPRTKGLAWISSDYFELLLLPQ